jgi:uncharacterized membrane protein
MARALRTALVAIVALAYPFVLLTGLDHLAARTIGAAVLAFLVAMVLFSPSRQSRLLTLVLRRFGSLIVVALVATATNEPVVLQLLPSITSLWLLVVFGRTLAGGTSMVGQFATAMHDGFPDFLLPYCRKVTWVWCGFFAANAIVGAALAAFATPEHWALYTGFVSYLVIAALAAGEYVFHKSRFRFYEHGWADRAWRRLCPPEQTALGRRTLAWQLERERRGESDPPAMSPSMQESPR